MSLVNQIEKHPMRVIKIDPNGKFRFSNTPDEQS